MGEPKRAVDVEDAAAEEVLEMVDNARAFGEVGGVGFEVVVEIGRVGGDEAADVAGTVEGDGEVVGGGEEGGHP